MGEAGDGSGDAAVDGSRGDRALVRVLALSDGVFAIALTLLVLNLAVAPDLPASDVGAALVDVAPEVGAYALSFAVISMLWLAHHRLFAAVERVDQRLMVTNLVHLGLIALVPFPTELIGTHGDAAPAAAAYAAVLGLASLAGAGSALHVLRAGLAPGVPRDVLVHGVWRGVSAGGVFLASLPLALVSTTAMQLSWLLAAVAHRVLARLFAGGRRRR